MTSLLEKTLIVGFGTLILIMIFPTINQYVNNIYRYDEERTDIDKFINLVEIIDDGINQIEEKNINVFNSSIEIPENLKIIIKRNQIVYSLLINNDLCERKKIYNSTLAEKEFFFDFSFKGTLKIKLKESIIQINISSIKST
ncbi:MAG: hypothetical protein R6U96_11965 [Promethearchaeia archaeon]